MRALKTNKIIFSAYLASRTEFDNSNQHAKLISVLNSLQTKEGGFDFIEVLDKYEGVSEKAVLVASNSYEKIRSFIPMAAELGQEAALIVHNDDVAEMVYLKPRFEPKSSQILGHFVEVSREEALENKGFTQIRNQYFVSK